MLYQSSHGRVSKVKFVFCLQQAGNILLPVKFQDTSKLFTARNKRILKHNLSKLFELGQEGREGRRSCLGLDLQFKDISILS